MLTKLPTQVFVPGSPAVAARPAQTVCVPVAGQPQGYWRRVCSAVQLFVGWNNGPASFDNPGPFPKPVYIDGGVVCRSEWVPAPVTPHPPQPPVCTFYPEVIGRPAVPGRVDNIVDQAWNAGANSVQELDGDVRVRFTTPAAIGSIIGFTGDREAITDPDRITHGFAFTLQQSGAALAHVREGSRVRTAALQFAPGQTEFEIRRAGGAVLYLVDDLVIYRSREPSVGPVSVGCALYASGDRAP